MDDDLFDMSTHGGKRAGAGRRPGYSPKEAKRIEVTEILDRDTRQTSDDTGAPETTTLAVRKARAQTADIEWKALQSELNYKKDSGEYLSRTAYREASATLLAEVAQALRSLPDLLERKCGLPTDALLKAEQVIDDCLSTLSAGLEMFTEAHE